MTDIIYANGDSFTYGVGLSDQSEAYPYLIAKEKQCFLYNDGYPGASHDRILRRTLQFISENQNQKMFVIIGWGFARRMEFYYDTVKDREETEDNYIRYSSEPLDERTKHRYPDEECRQFIELYDRNFTNRNAATTRALTRIISLQSVLKSLNIPYLFFNSAWTLPHHPTLISMIDTNRYYGFQNLRTTFNNWTWNNGYTGRTELGHPDADAHKSWAEELQSYLTMWKLWDI